MRNKSAISSKLNHVFQSEIWILFVGVGLAFFIAILLTLWGSLCVCFGMNPEAIYGAEPGAPLLGLICGGFWAGKRTSSGWRSGLAVALAMIGLWVIAWVYLTTRFDRTLFLHDALGGLTIRHGWNWTQALCAGAIGGALGTRLGRKRFAGLWVSTTVLAALPIMMQIGLMTHNETYAGRPIQLSSGAIEQTNPPDADGTIVRLLTVDLTREPDLGFGVYDADSDDAVPGDDRNGTWLGQSIPLVFDKLQKSAQQHDRSVRAVINGGFFAEDDDNFAIHEAALVTQGTQRYDSDTLWQEWPQQAWVFEIRHINGQTSFRQEPLLGAHLEGAETALGGVRPLRTKNQSLTLKPGMGGTTMRCSRTSVAWSADSQRIYILSVRDPDGESGSANQRDAHQRQIGGWDVRQVQQFWEQLGFPKLSCSTVANLRSLRITCLRVPIS